MSAKRKSLAPFNELAVCPKCRGTDMHSHHCEGGEWEWDCTFRIERDHIHRRCNRCKFEWAEACLDASPSADRKGGPTRAS